MISWHSVVSYLQYFLQPRIFLKIKVPTICQAFLKYHMKLLKNIFQVFINWTEKKKKFTNNTWEVKTKASISSTYSQKGQTGNFCCKKTLTTNEHCEANFTLDLFPTTCQHIWLLYYFLFFLVFTHFCF